MSLLEAVTRRFKHLKTVKDVERHLKDNGYTKSNNSSGSHDKWKHTSGKIIMVPRHSGDLSYGVIEKIGKTVELHTKINETLEKLQKFYKIVNGKKTKVPTKQQKQYLRIDD